jgi:hypothetical protein
MTSLAELIAAEVPAGARALLVGPEAEGLAAAVGNGATPATPEQLAAGKVKKAPFAVAVCVDVLGLAEDPAAVLAAVREAAGDAAALLVAEPDAEQLLRDPARLAGERRRRFTTATMEEALAGAGLAVVGWPARRNGVLLARVVASDAAEVVQGLRRELAALQERVAAVDELREERDALQARVVALEARLLSAHEQLADQDAEVVRLVDSDRELRQVKGTTLWRAGQRYWHLKLVARRAAARGRRALRG